MPDVYKCEELELVKVFGLPHEKDRAPQRGLFHKSARRKQARLVQTLDGARRIRAGKESSLDQCNLPAQTQRNDAGIDVLQQFLCFILSAFDIGQGTIEQPLIYIDPVTRKLSHDLRSSTTEQEHDERLAILRIGPHRRFGGKKLLADSPDQRQKAAMRLGVSVCDLVLHCLQRSDKLMRFARGRGRIRRSGKRCPCRE